MLRATTWMGLLGGLVIAGPVLSADRTLHPLDTYAILGREEVRLGADTVVESGQVGAIGGTVNLGRKVRVAENVAGDTIELGRGAVAGSLTCRFVQTRSAATCSALTLPVAELGTLRLSQPPLGAISIEVKKKARSAPVPPGDYGDVTVGTRGELILQGGSYTMRSLTIKPRGSFQCNSKCNVRVQDAVVLRSRATLGATAPLDARSVRIDIEGSGKAFDARPLTTVAATVFASQGTVFLGRRGRFEGAFVGRTVQTGTSVHVKENSAL